MIIDDGCDSRVAVVTIDRAEIMGACFEHQGRRWVIDGVRGSTRVYLASPVLDRHT